MELFLVCAAHLVNLEFAVCEMSWVMDTLQGMSTDYSRNHPRGNEFIILQCREFYETGLLIQD
ncbi:hypothetical protein ES703_101578 [subsurface metagenome]